MEDLYLRNGITCCSLIILGSQATFESWSKDSISNIILSDVNSDDCPEGFVHFQTPTELSIQSEVSKSISLIRALGKRSLCFSPSSPLSQVLTAEVLNPITGATIYPVSDSCVPSNPFYCFDFVSSKLGTHTSFQLVLENTPGMPPATRISVENALYSTNSTLHTRNASLDSEAFETMRQSVSYGSALTHSLQNLGDDDNSQMVKQLLGLFAAIVSYFAISKDSQQMTVLAAILTSAGTIGYLIYQQNKFIKSAQAPDFVLEEILSYGSTLPTTGPLSNHLTELTQLFETVTSNTSWSLSLLGGTLICLLCLIMTYIVKGASRPSEKEYSIKHHAD